MMRSTLMKVFALTAQALAAAHSSSHTPAATSFALGSSSYTAPGVFPTSLFSKYYNNPTATAEQPAPKISDPVLHTVFPDALTNPKSIPTENDVDPHPLPQKASDKAILTAARQQLASITNNTVAFNGTCAQCQAALAVGKFVALAAPHYGPDIVVAICEAFKASSSCETLWGAKASGAVITQVLAFADVGGFDGQMICENFIASSCPLPPATPLNLTGWFDKPKPDPVPAPKQSTGEKLKVLHLSDFHIDPRYMTGSEANCTSGLCCRENNHQTGSENTTVFPAPRFGAYLCDTPYMLAGATIEAIPVLTGTQDTGFDFTVYTGDLVSHDSENQLSRAYIEYTETVMYGLFKKALNAGPVYAALGNHDSYNQAQDAPHGLPGALDSQFSWNYDHVAALWEEEGWIDASAVKEAKAHYAGYSVQRHDGLRVITLNTDLWYRANWFAYINISNHDPSGMLRFLMDELQAAEDAGERVWIVGHVLTGWDGSNPLVNPTDLFYQIVDRFSPHVIANIFWGHTHEDQHILYYANNATVQNSSTALAQAWICPSVTPLTNLNSGFRVYEVDATTFEVLDAHTWRSDVNLYESLDQQQDVLGPTAGPSWVYEYSTRDTYGANITWGPSDPLNATWWHLVTEQMEANSSLVSTFNTLQGKESVRTPACTGDCATAKICYIRSGSAAIAKQNCNLSFGSVQ